MAEPIRTDLRTCLTRLKDLLVAGLVPPNSDDLIPAERVLIILRDTVPHLQAENDIILRPLSFRVQKPFTDQSGRWDTRIMQRLEVKCRTRNALDQPGTDELRLLDADYGHLAFVHAVLDILQEAQPTVSDDVEDVAFAFPMLLQDGTEPRPERRTTSSNTGWSSWSESSVFFEFEYTLANSTYPR